jgi:hypothetical protein
LIQTAPPLSATSDTPLGSVEVPPVSASADPTDIDNGVPKEMSPEAQAAARAAKVTDATPPDPDAIDVSDLSKDLPGYAVREITKARKAARDKIAAETATATKDAADARAEAEKVRAELAELRAKAEAAPPVKAEEPAAAAAEPRPTRDAFDDPDAYDTALTEWAAREGERRASEKLATETAAKAAEAAKATQDAEIARINADWAGKRAKAAEAYADYEAVAEGDHTVSPPMAHTIILAENGPDVAYYLGKHPDESARIAALVNPAMQIFEIGKLSAKLAAQPVRNPRPKPLEPIGTNGAPADTSGREPTMDEVYARTTARIAATRRPFLEASPGRH